MCIDHPVSFHSDAPITAYKVMYKLTSKKYRSRLAKNIYHLGSTYPATSPLNHDNVGFSRKYEVGFHAYERLQDATTICFNHMLSGEGMLRVVEVELSGVTHKGIEHIGIGKRTAVTYVAKRFKFIRAFRKSIKVKPCV